MIQGYACVPHGRHRQLGRWKLQQVIGIDTNIVARGEEWVLFDQLLTQRIEGRSECGGALPRSAIAVMRERARVQRVCRPSRLASPLPNSIASSFFVAAS